jgi:energy-coupling factor transporter ATP-binding protein EcfA2
MYIKKIKIRNFRALRSAEISLHPGLNILIGPNNVGKSTILSAIDFVLNPNLQWWQREVFTELDFFRGSTDDPIEVEVLVGCGRPGCLDGESKCTHLEIVTEDKSDLCRLAERTITWDNKKNKFLKVDEIDTAEAPESVIWLKMTATFQKAEGYVEASHWILNEDGTGWTNLTRPIKEWIGSRLLASNRDPMAECRMQYNSLLSKAVGDIKTWRIKCANGFRAALGPIVKELAESRANEITNLIDRTTRDIGRTHAEKTVLSLGEVQSYDIIRQVELCRKGSEGEDQRKKEWEIPFSRQGRGLQNVASLVLGIQTQSPATTGFSIIMLEEPEQNLEPQMQRSSVKSVRDLCGSDAQIIMSTHSPYILSSIMDLKGVQRLAKSDDGNLTSVDMGEISVDGWDFFKFRKTVPHDMELLEALFSPLVVIWEGDSEAGFYPALMRQATDYPSEWLAGVNGGDAGLKGPCTWFKKAGYETVVVLDGDNPEVLSSLSAEGVAFLALPPGKKLEHIVAEELSKKEEAVAAEILLSGIGVSGRINWYEEFHSIWAALAEIFKEKGLVRKTLFTDVALAEIKDTASKIGRPQIPNNIKWVLEQNKRRQVYESIGTHFHHKETVPAICSKVLDALKEMWLNKRPLGQYQFDASGNLRSYTPS